MRRMYVISGLCLLLLFVPIYIWKIQGGIGGSPDQELRPLDVSNDQSTVNDSSIDLNSVEDLAKRAPIELLRQCLLRYQAANISGYTCDFIMHETVNGRQKKPEVIECWYRDKPYSIFMHWKEGAEKAAASLYVNGENKNMVCIRPEPKALKFVGWATRTTDSDDVKEQARYSIIDFGVRCSTERTYKAWKALYEQGATLNVEYLGKQKVDELGGRECHLVRRHCNPPEEEGMTNVTLYIDAETWFQTGSVLMAGDRLIGKYFFKNIVVDPPFDGAQFKPETLKKY